MQKKDSRRRSAARSAALPGRSGGKAKGTDAVNRAKPCERFLFGCLLVALIVGVFFVKFWMMSVEKRLADGRAFHWTTVNNDHRLINLQWGHENRLRRVERTAWAVWDHHAPCDGWPTQQEIAEK